MLRAILSVIAYGSGMPQLRDGLYDKTAGAESLTLSPGLYFGLELGGPIQVGSQTIDVDEARSPIDAGRHICFPQSTAADIAAAPHKRLQQVWIFRSGLIQTRPHSGQRVFLAISLMI